MSQGIDWSQLNANNPYQQSVNKTSDYSMQLKQLRQKEGSEARTNATQSDSVLGTYLNNAQQNANTSTYQQGELQNTAFANQTQRQQVGQEGQYQQGLLQEGQQKIGIAQQAVDNAAVFDKAKVENERTKINLDGTRDLGDLAIRQQAAGRQFRVEDMKWQDMQTLKAAAKNGIEGYMQAMNQLGMYDKTIALSQAQQEYNNSVLKGKRSSIAAAVEESNADLKMEQNKNIAYGQELGNDMAGYVAMSGTYDSNPDKKAYFDEMGQRFVTRHPTMDDHFNNKLDQTGRELILNGAIRNNQNAYQGLINDKSTASWMLTHIQPALTGEGTRDPETGRVLPPSNISVSAQIAQNSMLPASMQDYNNAQNMANSSDPHTAAMGKVALQQEIHKMWTPQMLTTQGTLSTNYNKSAQIADASEMAANAFKGHENELNNSGFWDHVSSPVAEAMDKLGVSRGANAPMEMYQASINNLGNVIGVQAGRAAGVFREATVKEFEHQPAQLAKYAAQIYKTTNDLDAAKGQFHQMYGDTNLTDNGWEEQWNRMASENKVINDNNTLGDVIRSGEYKKYINPSYQKQEVNPEQVSSGDLKRAQQVLYNKKMAADARKGIEEFDNSSYSTNLRTQNNGGLVGGTMQ